MGGIEFVNSPTDVKLIGCSTITGNHDDFEKVQAAIYLAQLSPKRKLKNIFNSLSENQTERIIDYIVEEDFHQLEHTWLNFMIDGTRIATMHEVSDHKSYTQKSQRYSTAAPKSHVPYGVNDELFEEVFKPVVQAGFDLYYKMETPDNVEGVNKEDARDVLSLSAMTSIVSNRNTFDELQMIRSSTSRDKPLEIRLIGEWKYNILRKLAPNIFDEDMNILKKFPVKKNLTSLEYSNQEIEEILKDITHSVSESDIEIGYVDVPITPEEPGLISGLAAMTTRDERNFLGLLKAYENGEISLEKIKLVLGTVMSSGHTSVAEHDMYLIEDRSKKSLNHQKTRHRHIIDSYTPLDVAGQKFEYDMHPSIEKFGFKKEYEEHMEKIKEAFDILKEHGVKEAYYILPNGIKMDSYITTNATEITYILEKRLCKNAQEPIRNYFAIPLYNKMRRILPQIFDDAVPGCLKDGCREKWPCFDKKRGASRQVPYKSKDELL